MGSRKARKAKAMNAMDEQIWKEFPEELLEVVLAMLPIDALFRCRLVCREWNSLHESRNFLQRREEVAPRNKPWLYCMTDAHGTGESNGAMYDPCSKKWRSYSPCTPSFYPVASVGGLVCCVDRTQNRIFVGNPVTKTWKELPVSSLDGFASVGMVMHTRGYKIFAGDTRGKFEVYDSLTSNSESLGALIPGVYRPMSQVTRYTNNYFLVSCLDGILTYDVVSGVHERICIPAPSLSSQLALAECSGRAFLTGLVPTGTYLKVYDVCVWELHMTMLEWNEVAKMPKSWCLESSPHNEAHLKCLVNRGVIMMELSTKQMTRTFTYDVVNRKWSMVPRFYLRGQCQSIVRGVVFFPSLSAAP